MYVGNWHILPESDISDNQHDNLFWLQLDNVVQKMSKMNAQKLLIIRGSSDEQQ